MTDTPVHPLVRAFNERMTRFAAFLIAKERIVLSCAALAFIMIISVIGAWKLWAFGYNALDLAIYRQVAAESIRGHLFSFSIHPHSYLGDHLELLYVIVWPFYALLKSPLTLVVVQAIALAASVFPVAAIVRRFLPRPWHLIFALGFLANPVIQNMSLYEFHLLPFSIPILSFAILTYLTKRYSWYLFCLVLACLVREDVSFVVFGFGLLALIDRRSWKWSIVPMLLGAGWLIAALKITALFNGYGHYKFLAYYGWLGQSVPEIAKNLFLHVDRVLLHLVQPQALAFMAALLLPFAFLPVFRLRWIVPVVPNLLQYLLLQTPSELVIEIHYPSVFLPFLTVASAAAFATILDPSQRSRALNRLSKERGIAAVVVIIVVVYSMLVIGPLAQSLPILARTAKIADRVSLERDFVRSVPDGPVAAGFETITDLSDRPELYSLHYQFLGKKQYSDEDYSIPDDTRTALVDMRDFLMYQLLYKYNNKDTRNGYKRVRNFLADGGFVLTAYCDRFALYEKNGVASTDLAPYTIGEPSIKNGSRSTHDDLEFIAWTTPTNTLKLAKFSLNDRMYTIVPISLAFKKTNGSNTGDLFDNLQVQFVEDGKVRYQSPMPLGGGMYPPHDWAVGETVTSNYRLLVPSFLERSVIGLRIVVYRSGGEVSLNGARSMVIKYRDPEQLGDVIDLGPISR